MNAVCMRPIFIGSSGLSVDSSENYTSKRDIHDHAYKHLCYVSGINLACYMDGSSSALECLGRDSGGNMSEYNVGYSMIPREVYFLL